MKAFTGKVLWIDLTSGTWSEEIIPDSIYQKYLAGIGLGAWLLYREIPKGADPLGPQNVLGFMSGLLTGTGSLFTGRWMAVAKSPLTGTWGDANCGGTLAYAIKQCGYDGILFKGQSAKPVYLYVDSHGPQLCDASHLWGKDAVETEDLLLSEYHGKKRPAIATIGTAGENLSLISGIVNDRGRLAARSGLGAVMGSKRLKAIVLAGAQRVVAHDPVKTKLLAWQCTRAVVLPTKYLPAKILALLGRVLGKLPVAMTQSGALFARVLATWGTVGTFQVSVGMGDTPFKNWTGSERDMPQVYDAIEPDRVRAIEKRKYHCRGCPIGCGGIVKLQNVLPGDKLPDEKPLDSHKPEYETIASFTSLLLNDDLELVYEINEMLNRAGMDTISAGGTVAFALECYERGWITKEDTGGLELTWGNSSAIRAVVQQMITRQGFGAWLSDGVKKAAEKLPPVAQEAAVHAGGQEVAYHDPRLDPGLGLHASVEPNPGHHTNGGNLNYEMYRLWTRLPNLPPAPPVYSRVIRYTPSDWLIESAVAASNFAQFYSSAGACYLGMMFGVDRVPIFEWTNAITGWKLSPEEYLRIGCRIQTLRQMFNIREGIDPRTLKISPRLTGNPPLEHGPNRGYSFDLQAFMQAYWKSIGWGEETGIPTDQTLRMLDLLDVVRAERREVLL